MSVTEPGGQSQCSQDLPGRWAVESYFEMKLSDTDSGQCVSECGRDNTVGRIAQIPVCGPIRDREEETKLTWPAQISTDAKKGHSEARQAERVKIEAVDFRVHRQHLDEEKFQKLKRRQILKLDIFRVHRYLLCNSSPQSWDYSAQ